MPAKFYYLFCIIIVSGFVHPSAGLEIFSPASVSSAGIIYHPENPAESQVNLAAGLGYFNRPGFTLGYNYLSEGNGFWGSFFLPTEIGVIGINYMHLDNTADADLTRGIIRAGFGKKLTRNLFAGFYLDFNYENPGSLESSIGFEPSLIYSTDLKNKNMSAFSIHSFFIYSGFFNLNVPLENSEISSDPGIFAGFGTKFISVKDFSAILQLQSSVNTNPDLIPLSAALKLQFLFFQLRAGYQYNFALSSGTSESGNLTAGAGFEYAFNEYTINIQYGLNKILSGNPDHYFSINSYFNTADKIPPKLTVTANTSEFSPNGDGIKDFVEFKIKVKDQSAIKDWSLLVKDEKGSVVKLFKKDTRKRSVIFPVYRIFSDLFKRNEYRSIPEKIKWEGRGESTGSIADLSENPESIDLPEGTYLYEMTVTDSQGHTSEPSRGTLILDRTKPEVNLVRHSREENPESGVFLSCIQSAKLSENTAARGLIKDSNNNVVKIFTWELNSNLPHTVTWDGKTKNHKPAPEGHYSYTLELTDPAGNTGSAEINQIIVHYQKRKIISTADHLMLSPNGDGIDENIKFNVKSEAKNLIRWNAVITRTKIQKEKKIAPVFNWQGNSGEIPESFVWDGKDRFGKTMPGQKYYFTIIAEEISGEKLQSMGQPFYLDIEPPAVSIFTDAENFSPDGDGYNDEMSFYISFNDQSAIKNYEFNIYEVNKINGSETRKIFRQWKSEGKPPKQIFFDGISANGNLMKTLGKYEYSMKITDQFNNTRILEGQKFYSGILVNPDNNKLKIILTGQRFKPNGTPVNYLALEKIFFLLKYDYPDYRVRIESHMGNPGDEEENLVLSEKRAKKIFEYFISNGMESSRIGYQGYGEIVPLSEIDNPETNYKNDRIEFILIK